MLSFQIYPSSEELKDIVSSYFIAQVTDRNDLPFVTEMYPLNIPALNFLSNRGIYKYRNPTEAWVILLSLISSGK